MKKQFFKQILLLSALFNAQLCAEQVIVIGAGLAGLTAAYRLKQAGYEVQIFEARERPGGRVCTVYFSEEYDELGGQNIYDGAGNSLCELAQELNVSIVTYYIKRDMKCYHDNNIFHWRNLFKGMQEPTEKKYKELCELKNLGEVISNLVGTKSTPLRSMLEVSSACYEGFDVDRLSMLYFNSFWSCYKVNFYDLSFDTDSEFEICTVKNGMSNLIEALCKAVGPCIHYNCSLIKLQRNEKNGFILHMNDREIYATKIILALPYSTLRDVELEEKIFPADQLDFIKTLGYGTNAKILMPTSGETVQYCGFNSDCSMLHSHKVMWLEFGGRHGIFDSSTKESLQIELKKHLPALNKLYPELIFDEDIAPVVFTNKPYVKTSHSVGISWIHEPYSKGSYSCLAPGQEIEYEKTQIDCGQNIRSLFRSIEKNIFFAGEHTAFESSTMEGAVESGERAARMIIDSLEN